MIPKFLWLIDNGHGGIINGIYQTAGKRSPIWPDGTQLFEGEFNRSIAKGLTVLCDEHGLKYQLIADTEKDMPLEERTHLANDIYLKEKKKENHLKCVYVSIHADAFTNSQANGWTVYTSEGETKSDKFATIFYNEMKKMFPEKIFRHDYYDGDPDKESQFWVLRKTYMPSILTENFFMTNYEDCKLLLSEEGRNKIIKAHFNAMLFAENNF